MVAKEARGSSAFAKEKAERAAVRDGIVKIGIDSYCFHRLFGEVYDGTPAPDAPMSVGDFLAFAKELNVDGVSLESCFLPSMEESAQQLIKLAAKYDTEAQR